MYGMDSKLKLRDQLANFSTIKKNLGICNLNSVIISRVLRILASHKKEGRTQKDFPSLINIKVQKSEFVFSFFRFASNNIRFIS